MAGTIAKHIKKGDKVYVISMTDGVGARNEAKIDHIKGRKDFV